jgi:hypothetical protein
LVSLAILVVPILAVEPRSKIVLLHALLVEGANLSSIP